MSRLYNFSAGPATLPLPVLTQAQAELLDWQNKGMSVMEMSHRGVDFTQIAKEAETDLRDLLAIPPHYRVLFMQGGASTQFAAIPLNLLGLNSKADYLDTGVWATKAIEEAKRYGDVHIVASSKNLNYKQIPSVDTWNCRGDAAYLHCTLNETINGTEIEEVPYVNSVPVVIDASSTLLSRPLNVARYGVIYAGAQKNIGAAGVTLVIIREDLLQQALSFTPTMLRYQVCAQHDSMYNTPPTYAWYIAGLVFKWLKQQGGLMLMAERNRAKAELLYQTIDNSDGFYRNPIAVADRSLMNVPFILQRSELEPIFLQAAEESGLVGLAGHRSVGGLRASIYNAMPFAGVQALTDFMRSFMQRYG